MSRGVVEVMVMWWWCSDKVMGSHHANSIHPTSSSNMLPSISSLHHVNRTGWGVWSSIGSNLENTCLFVHTKEQRQSNIMTWHAWISWSYRYVSPMIAFRLNLHDIGKVIWRGERGFLTNSTNQFLHCSKNTTKIISGVFGLPPPKSKLQIELSQKSWNTQPWKYFNTCPPPDFLFLVTKRF